MAVFPLNPVAVTPYVLPEQEGATTGHLNRTFQGWQKLDRLVLDVAADFGGNPLASSSVNKAAIEEAAAVAKARVNDLGGGTGGGAELRLSDGAWTTLPLEIDQVDNLTITGINPGGSSLALDPDVSDDPLLYVTNSKYLNVRDLILYGNEAGSHLLYMFGCTRANLDRLFLWGCAGTAIQIQGDGSHSGLGNFLRDIRIRLCGGAGVFLYGQNTTDHEFDTIDVGQCDAAGIRVESSANTMSHIHSWGNGTGIQVVNGTMNTIGQSHIETNVGAGLSVFNAKDTLIEGSKVWGNGTGGSGGGVSFAGTSDYGKVHNNIIRDNTGNGIDIASDYCTIGGNTCRDTRSSGKTQVYGIRIAGTADRSIVVGNLALNADHVTAGIGNAGTNTTAANNIVS